MDGEIINIELNGFFADNQIVNLNLIPHRDNKGRTKGVICVGTDVTNYRLIEK